jgi:glycerate-2-kinase
MILTTMLRGEAKDAGVFLASVAKEVALHNRPAKRPCAIIAGGENTVTILGQCGYGGPNQELALSSAVDIAGLDNVLVLSLDTDGTDGPTQLAGGMVDGTTIAAARERGLDVLDAIRDHDAGTVLQATRDAIVTGSTETNVNDLKFLLVS